MAKFFEGIKRNVVVLGLVSALTDVSSEMIFPLLPLFLTQVLGASAAVLGLIEGIAESTSSLFKLVSGWLSDKLRVRKPIILLGYGFSAAVKPLFALASVWQHVLAARFLDRVGKGLRSSPRDALIADVTAKRFRGKAFGFHRSMDTIGAVIGPLLAFVALSVFASSYRSVFWLSLIPAALAVVLIYFFVKEKKPAATKRASGKLDKQGNQAKAGKQTALSLALLKRFPPSYRAFVFATSLFALGNFSFAFLILRANSLGIAAAAIPLVYLLFNLVYLVSAMPSGLASDKFGGKRVLALGYLCFAFVCVGFALASNAWQAAVLFALYGVFVAVNDTLSRIVSVDFAPRELRGSALGLQQMLASLMALPSSIIAGILWTAAGAASAFFFGAVIAFASFVVLLFFVK